MARIVGGLARGRRLSVPRGRAVRPTSDRVREALFNALEADLRGLAGRAFLDLYAGTGAVGLEALSRGADPVLLVESDPRAAAAVRANLQAVGLPGARLAQTTVARLLARGPRGREGGPYDVVFADPPYAVPDAVLAAQLRALADGGWLAAQATVVVERATRGGEFAWPAGYRATRVRRYGDTSLWYGRASRGVTADAARAAASAGTAAAPAERTDAPATDPGTDTATDADEEGS